MGLLLNFINGLVILRVKGRNFVLYFLIRIKVFIVVLNYMNKIFYRIIIFNKS